MKTYLILILLLIGSVAHAQLKIENQWVLKERLGETSVFLKKEMSLSTFEGVAPEKRNLTSANYKTKVTATLESRKKTLSVLGYKNWNVNDIKFTEKDGKQIVQLGGSYQLDNIDFEFSEWQIYSGYKYTTLQLEYHAGETQSQLEKKYLEVFIKDLK